MNWSADWPVWLVALTCAAGSQLTKVLIYSFVRRSFTPSVFVQTYGLPSLPAAVLACLLVVSVLRQGWHSGEASFALVFAVIVIFDAVRVRGAAKDQRFVVFHIVEALPDSGPWRQRVAGYLDARTHHPVHVTVGVIYGGLFALAFGLEAG